MRKMKENPEELKATVLSVLCNSDLLETLVSSIDRSTQASASGDGDSYASFARNKYSEASYRDYRSLLRLHKSLLFFQSK